LIGRGGRSREGATAEDAGVAVETATPALSNGACRPVSLPADRWQLVVSVLDRKARAGAGAGFGALWAELADEIAAQIGLTDRPWCEDAGGRR